MDLSKTKPSENYIDKRPPPKEGIRSIVDYIQAATNTGPYSEEFKWQQDVSRANIEYARAVGEMARGNREWKQKSDQEKAKIREQRREEAIKRWEEAEATQIKNPTQEELGRMMEEILNSGPLFGNKSR